MLSKLKNWLGGTRAVKDAPPHAVTAKTRPHAAANDTPPPAPEPAEPGDYLSSEIESLGPGKNVLVRRKFIREDSGTHETLTILDDSIIQSANDEGVDPYNTGCFDRSKSWNARFTK
ncbi:MAG: hypothetical protein KJO56_04880 [Gammaproteobacteria bacterium]|nr:hypothetical protein [Gammaproteobacteria bacterium]MBT8106230.1 hypothetical protein [Gammaproteobacteria bacterium]NNK26244.1 hypothetical protein [Woeseiaceae bacterium]